MDRLSACYFCGAATGGDLREVRVAGDDAVTVTLCGDCTRRLARLADATGAPLDLDAGAASTARSSPGSDRSREPGADAEAGARTTEVGAVESNPDTAGESDAGDADEPGTETASQPDTGATDEPGAGGAGADVASGTDAGGDEGGLETADSGAGGASDDDPGIPEDARIFTDDEEGSLGPDPLSDSRESVGDEPLATDDDRSDEPSRSFAASQAAGGRRESSHGARRGRDSGDDPDADGATGGDPAPTEERDDAGADGSEAPLDSSEVDVATVPRETYNKVVRLLQNRSFPVEREAVLSVATSAYGLSRRNCDATIDALVDRGVLEESEDGQRLFRA